MTIYKSLDIYYKKMAGQKPNEFQLLGQVQGNIELYTQTNNNPRKFSVDDLKQYIVSGTTIPFYSETEQLLPYKWFTGADIYRIVILHEMDTSGVDSITHNLNIKTYINVDIWAIDSFNGYHLKLKSKGGLTGADSDFTWSFADANQIDEIITDATNAPSIQYTDVMVIIDYVKF